MRGSNHPSSNQTFPLLISYQFCGFWKLSFNIFIQVFLQVSWEREKHKFNNRMEIVKVLLKAPRCSTQNQPKLDQKAPPTQHSFKPRVSKGHSVIPHPTPAHQFLWPFFVVLLAHFPITCLTFPCYVVEIHTEKADTHPAPKRVMDHGTGPSTGCAPAQKHLLIFSQLTFYALPLSHLLFLALVSWIQTGLLSLSSVCKAFSTIWLQLTWTTRFYAKRNYCC